MADNGDPLNPASAAYIGDQAAQEYGAAEEPAYLYSLWCELHACERCGGDGGDEDEDCRRCGGSGIDPDAPGYDGPPPI